MAYGTGTTQCPHCGSVGNYKVTMGSGGQVLNCKSCRKNFIAEVRQGQFTGRSR